MSEIQEINNSLVTADLISNLSELLTKSKFKEAISTMNDNKYSACLKENSWDLIPILSNHLKLETNMKSPELFECAENLLLIIAEKANPKEALLGFIEEAEVAKDDEKFFVILKCLQKILSKLTTKRCDSLKWILNTIQSYANELPQPGEYNLESDEKVLQDSDDSVHRITLFYTKLLPFYRPYIEEILSEPHNPDRKKTKEILISFMLQLLGKPLASLNFEYTKNMNRSRFCAEKIMQYLSDLVGDCFMFLEYVNEKKMQISENKTDDDDDINDEANCMAKVSNLCFGVYYYLILSENVQFKSYPKIYNHLYIFQSILKTVVNLLSHSEQFITRKGLLLAHSLICSDLIESFPYIILDSPVHSLFCKNLVNIIIYSDLKEYRRIGLKVFKTYLFKFDNKGKYLLVQNIFTSVEHVNTRGYLISQYKEMVHSSFKAAENKIPDEYCGQKLFKILNMFTYLPEGAESDLAVLGDQIITSINFMIYLAIRDKYNATGIWNYFNNTEDKFIKPLQKGIQLSKEHYELKMKELQDKPQPEEVKPSNVCVKVNKMVLPKVSPAEERSCLQSCINSFETLEMLLSRLKQLIDEGPSINI